MDFLTKLFSNLKEALNPPVYHNGQYQKNVAITSFLGKFLIALILFGVATRFFLASTTMGTNDLFVFMVFADFTAQHGPFAVYGILPYYYNHPPVSALGLEILGKICPSNFLTNMANTTLQGHISDTPFQTYFPYCLGFRTLPILADCLSIFLVWRLAGLGAATVVALSPTLILTSGYHGNTDCIVAAGIVTAFYLSQKKLPLLSGICTAITSGVKLPALLTIPTMTVVFQKRDRLKYLLTAGGLAVLIFGTWTLIGGHPFFKNVLAYHPDNGNPTWGIAWLLHSAGVSVQGWFPRLTSMAAWGVSFFCAWRFRNHQNPVAPTVFALLGTLALANNVAPQYFAWVVPVAAILSPRKTLLYSVLASAFQFLIYYLWADHPFQAWCFSNAIGSHVEAFWYTIPALPIWLFITYWFLNGVVYKK